jgi:hypothetical protein
MPLRKKIAIILICFTALLPLFLSSFFLGGRLAIRIIMFEKLEKENIQSLRLKADKINWYKKGRELIIDGKMFDVKSMEKQGDEYMITGLFDEMETTLNDQLTMAHDRSNQHTNISNQLLQACLGIIAIQLINTDLPTAEGPEINRVHFSDFSTPLIARPLVIFSPPPEYCAQL